jgi:hypothetical protein
MAAGVNTTAAVLLVDEFNVTTLLREVELTAEQATADNTTLGQTARTRQITHRDGGIQISGLFTRATGELFDTLKGALGSAAAKVATLFPEGVSLGYPAVLCYANETRFDDGLRYDDLVSVAAYLQASDDALDFGVALQPLSAVTGTGNGTSVDNAASTANGGVGVIHTTAVAGAAPSVVWKIQHSSDNSTFADLVTFTAATAAGKERIEVAAGTTVNRYLRAIRTFGGTTTSITSAVAFARRA